MRSGDVKSSHLVRLSSKGRVTKLLHKICRVATKQDVREHLGVKEAHPQATLNGDSSDLDLAVGPEKLRLLPPLVTLIFFVTVTIAAIIEFSSSMLLWCPGGAPFALRCLGDEVFSLEPGMNRSVSLSRKERILGPPRLRMPSKVSGRQSWC